MATIKIFKIRTKYAAWLTDTTKVNIKLRDSAQKTASSTGKQEDWEIYKKLRNEISGVLEKEKDDWQRINWKIVRRSLTLEDCGKMCLVG